MCRLAGGMHNNEHLAAVWSPTRGGPSLRNELAFGDRQAQTDEITLGGSEGDFPCFSWGVNQAVW